jgi:hypothetical protein
MVQVIKADGSIEPFSEEKVLRSIKRAGVPQDLQNKVLQSIKTKLYDNIPTHDIYGYITDALAHSEEPFSKARYSLKQAIMLLGPTGYPFEDFIARIYQEYNYTTQTRQTLMGKCVMHEIDVIAQKDKNKILIEAKFHNNAGTRSEVQVPLYINSRFEDLKDKYDFDEAWLVTNTKATTDAIAYAECVGMKVVSWNYPENKSLRDMVEEKNLHPITMLSTLSLQQKAHLMANHTIICRDILEKEEALSVLGLPLDIKKEVLEEASYIVTTHDHSD